MQKGKWCVVRCPNCGRLSIAHTYAYTHRCFRCGCRFVLNPKHELSRILFDSNDINECRKYIYRATGWMPPEFKKASEFKSYIA